MESSRTTLASDGYFALRSEKKTVVLGYCVPIDPSAIPNHFLYRTRKLFHVLSASLYERTYRRSLLFFNELIVAKKQAGP